MFTDHMAARVTELERNEHGEVVQQLGLSEMLWAACESVWLRLRMVPKEPVPHKICLQLQFVVNHTCQ